MQDPNGTRPVGTYGVKRLRTAEVEDWGLQVLVRCAHLLIDTALDGRVSSSWVEHSQLKRYHYGSEESWEAPEESNTWSPNFAFCVREPQIANVFLR